MRRPLPKPDKEEKIILGENAGYQHRRQRWVRMEIGFSERTTRNQPNDPVFVRRRLEI